MSIHGYQDIYASVYDYIIPPQNTKNKVKMLCDQSNMAALEQVLAALHCGIASVQGGA